MAKPSEQVAEQPKVPTPPRQMKMEEKKEPKPQQKKVSMDTSVMKQQVSNRIGKYQQQ